MKKFSKFTQIDEISTGKLTDYVAKASMDVGRRIEKAEPGVKPMKKILDRSGKIGRAKAHIQIKANESVEASDDLDEAIKLGSKVKMHAPGKDYHDKVGNIGEIRHGAFKGAAKTYTVDYGDNKSVQLSKKNVKLHAESMDMCNVCGQTPCNCTSIDEGTVQDKIDKAAKIYNTHRALADKARKVGPDKKRDPEAEAHHMKKSHKAFDLMQKLRKGSSEANKSNPKPKPKESNYGSAIAQDYKDQEAKRGIGHVRDSVELDDTKSIIELKDSTLKSYIRQSSGDVSHKQNVANRFGMTNKVREVIKKRNAGQTVAQRKLGEDVEQVDELNISTVKSYLKKAKKAEVTHDANATKLLRASKKAFHKKDAEELYAKAADQQGRSSSRSRGIPMAQARLAKEEIEQVDELKVGTLLRYNTKAIKSSTKHGGEAGRAIDAGDRETAAKHFAKRDSRDAGARRALAKILAKKKTV